MVKLQRFLKQIYIESPLHNYKFQCIFKVGIFSGNSIVCPDVPAKAKHKKQEKNQDNYLLSFIPSPYYVRHDCKFGFEIQF